MAHSAQRSTMEAAGLALPKSEHHRERREGERQGEREGEGEREVEGGSNFFVFMIADLLAMTW